MMPSTCRLGICVTRSDGESNLSSPSCAPVSTVTDTGTLSRVSARFCAVTTTSSSAPPSVGAGACACTTLAKRLLLASTVRSALAQRRGRTLIALI